MSPIPLGIFAVSGAAPVGPTSGFELISTVLTTDGQATIDFTGLNSLTEYKHLYLKTSLRADAGPAANLNIRFNDDESSTRYVHFNQYAQSTTISNSSSVSDGYIVIRNAVGPASPSLEYSPSYVYIYDFLSTQKFKTTSSMTGGTVGDQMHSAFGGGVWESTAAINKITLRTPVESDLNLNSIISLYGIRG